jgi:fumarylpyruvate hydrolase
MSYVIAPPAQAAAAVKNSSEQFAVHRIYCVGRNYAAHAREMGKDPDREPPFFFMKPADAVVANGKSIPYPTRTQNLNHEVEMVVAIGTGGANIAAAAALGHIFGYAVGNDLTRRDLQAAAKDQGRPWDIAKGFDNSAPITAIHTVAQVGHPSGSHIWLKVNGSMRQEGKLSEMIWSVPEIIAELSTLYTLVPGDLIFTGTPAGVGTVKSGDRMECGIEGFDTLSTALL